MPAREPYTTILSGDSGAPAASSIARKRFLFFSKSNDTFVVQRLMTTESSPTYRRLPFFSRC